MSRSENSPRNRRFSQLPIEIPSKRFFDDDTRAVGTPDAQIVRRGTLK